MKRIHVLVVIFVLVFTGMVSGNEALVIRVGHVGAPVSPQQGAAKIFVEQVNEVGQGKIEIRIYGASTLGDERELVEGMVIGTIDGAIVSAGLYSMYEPSASVFEIPFLFKDRDHANRVNSGPIGQGILERLSASAGIEAVAIWEHGFRHVTNGIRPIKIPSDFSGLKIRSPEVPVYSEPLKALGAVPVPMAFAELYLALDRGVVDGQHNPLLHVAGQRFYEVQQYLTMMDFAYTPNIVAFSRRLWNTLTPEQQVIITTAARKTVFLWAERAAAEEAKTLDEIRTKMEVIDRGEFDRAAFASVVREKVYPRFVAEYGEIINQIIKEGEAE